jgi:hypothetical protein
MKKIYTIFILSLLFAFSSRAQLTFIDSSRNEIGININPLLQPFGINATFDYMTLQYKHHYENSSLRVGFSVTTKNTYDDYDLSKYSFKIKDSIKAVYQNYETKNSFKLNIGFEQQQMLKNKLKIFYGLDILGGFSNHEYRVETNVYKLGADSIYSPVQYYNDSTTALYNYILGGVAFVAGFDYFIFDRVSAGIQGYFPIYYEFETGSSATKSSSLTLDAHFSIMLKMHF